MKCPKCKKFTICHVLCKRAEKYVNQDFVRKKHRTYRFAVVDDLISNDYKPVKSKKILDVVDFMRLNNVPSNDWYGNDNFDDNSMP
jgi:hypothetical protein